MIIKGVTYLLTAKQLKTSRVQQELQLKLTFENKKQILWS